VEEGIHYLPLFPDDNDNVFHQDFFSSTPNAVSAVLAETTNQEAYIKLIDIREAGNGRPLHMKMNGRKNYALAYFGTSA
jgi:hypothetical protein